MKKLKQTKAGMFLLEIMLNTFFFVILVTICLQLFFKAYSLSKNTTELHNAVSTCSSVAEIYQSGIDGKESIANIYPHSLLLTDAILIFFDENYHACLKDQAVYRVMISLSDEEYRTASIIFSNPDGTDVIYTLEISTYRPQSVSVYTGGGQE